MPRRRTSRQSLADRLIRRATQALIVVVMTATAAALAALLGVVFAAMGIDCHTTAAQLQFIKIAAGVIAVPGAVMGCAAACMLVSKL